MEDKDLIRELENLETPDIDLPGHRQALKAALLSSDRFTKKTSARWVRVLAPVAAAVALMVVFGFFNIVQPQLHIAQAREIATNDAGVQALMEQYGLAIADVRLQDGEAFVLLATRYVRGDPEHSTYHAEPAPPPPLQSAASRIVSRVLGWMIPDPTDEQRLSPTLEGELPPGAEEPSPLYILKVDLSGKKVSGFLEISYAAALPDIDLQGAHFAESAPPRDAPEEEPESH